MSFVIIEHNGVRRRLAVAKTAAGVWVGFPGGSALVPTHGQVTPRVGNDTIAAPMTGKVIEVATSVGQAVAVDEILVVIEAMKMEYRLAAPRSGNVLTISCRQGDLVELGAVLVTIGDAAAMCLTQP
jgi:biotin carboxyl carrier protein